MLIWRIFWTSMLQDNENRKWEQIGPDYKNLGDAIVMYTCLANNEEDRGHRLYKLQEHYSVRRV